MRLHYDEIIFFLPVGNTILPLCEILESGLDGQKIKNRRAVNLDQTAEIKGPNLTIRRKNELVQYLLSIS